MRHALSLIGYAALAAFILAFLFSNRTPVTLALFPFPYGAHMPLYVALCLLFVCGLLLGLMHGVLLWLSMRRKLSRAQRALAALEKELAARPLPH